MPWKTSKGMHPMPEPPQLAPFETKEQQLNSKVSLHVRAPHSISKADCSHPPEETHLGHLYLRSKFFSHYREHTQKTKYTQVCGTLNYPVEIRPQHVLSPNNKLKKKKELL